MVNIQVTESAATDYDVIILTKSEYDELLGEVGDLTERLLQKLELELSLKSKGM